MRAAVLLLSLTVLAGCEGSDGETHSPLRVLEAVNAAKDRTMVAGDPAALANYYTADYQGIDGDGEARDKRGQVRLMTEEVDLVTARSEDVQVRMLGKNAALVTGRVRGTYRLGGKDVPFDERFSSVWVNEDSQWRIRHEHSSDVTRPLPAEK